ncbi:MAG: hypothetical protein ACRDGM_03645 [bacterium]
MTQDESVDLIHFAWSIPDRGYTWDADARAEPRLGGKGEPPFLLVHPKTTRTRQYSPLPFDEPGREEAPLFQRFADIEPTQDAILKFANEYGWLGVDEPAISPYYPGVKAGEHIVTTGESLDRWRREIVELREASIIWRWLDEEDEEAMARAVRWESDGCVCVTVPRKSGRALREREILFHKRLQEDLFRLLRRDDPSVAVRSALLRTLNKKLRGLVSPCLLLDRKGQLRGFLRPHHMLGAIWLQLYQAVTGQRRLRTCQYCAGLMDVTGSRTDKAAHHKCMRREKTYRLRRKKALAGLQERLRKGRLTPEQRRRLRAREREIRVKLTR